MDNDPKLATGMVDDGEGSAMGGADGPATAQEIDLVIGVAAAREVKRQVEVQEAGIRRRAQGVPAFFLSLGPGVIGTEAAGAADGPIRAGQFLIQEGLCSQKVGDFLEGQQRDQPLLEGSEPTFDLPFGLEPVINFFRDS